MVKNVKKILGGHVLPRASSAQGMHACITMALFRNKQSLKKEKQKRIDRKVF